MYVWILPGYSGFLPPPKNMHVRLIGDSKLTLGVCVSVAGCLSHLSLCGPVINLINLLPNDSWDRLQLP